ncbi:MAG: N-acetyltransferase family protein [Parvularcula sp.]
MIRIKRTTANDAAAVLSLYRRAAAIKGTGLARTPEEITPKYIHEIIQANDRQGISLGAFQGAALVGELHARRMEPRQFAHVLTDLTIVVSPGHQGQGVGSRLFAALFDAVPTFSLPVTRIELVARSGNASAIRLYERLGFRVEGRFEKRVHLADGTYEDDIPLAWVESLQP